MSTNQTTAERLQAIIDRGRFLPGQKHRYLQTIADRLSEAVNKKPPPWGARYISGVAAENRPASQILTTAIMIVYDELEQKPKRIRNSVTTDFPTRAESRSIEKAFSMAERREILRSAMRERIHERERG